MDIRMGPVQTFRVPRRALEHRVHRERRTVHVLTPGEQPHPSVIQV